jgi:hypothetical protein
MALRALAIFPAFLAFLWTIALASPSHAQSDDERYTIMRPEPAGKASKPEPWLAPKYRSPRGTRQHVTAPEAPDVPPPRAQTPPPIYVPQTGRVLPNMPVISGSGRGGAETSQDRAMRCAHQAGAYGDAVGDRNAYLGSCVNQ